MFMFSTEHWRPTSLMLPWTLTRANHSVHTISQTSPAARHMAHLATSQVLVSTIMSVSERWRQADFTWSAQSCFGLLSQDHKAYSPVLRTRQSIVKSSILFFQSLLTSTRFPHCAPPAPLPQMSILATIHEIKQQAWEFRELIFYWSLKLDVAFMTSCVQQSQDLAKSSCTLNSRQENHGNLQNHWHLLYPSLRKTHDLRLYASSNLRIYISSIKDIFPSSLHSYQDGGRTVGEPQQTQILRTKERVSVISWRSTELVSVTCPVWQDQVDLLLKTQNKSTN